MRPKKKEMDRRKLTSVYLPPPIAKEVDDEARSESRSRSQMILMLVTEALRNRRASLAVA
jgi:metal-responsive CopG/Arc/MetJ family transcriptional regulator